MVRTRKQVIEDALAGVGVAGGVEFVGVAERLSELVRAVVVSAPAAVRESAQPGTAWQAPVPLGVGSGFGLGLSPLITGLVSLFGGGGSEQPAPLVPFARPAEIHVDAGARGAAPGAVVAVDPA